MILSIYLDLAMEISVINKNISILLRVEEEGVVRGKPLVELLQEA
jgi:hypothetical protein